MSPSYRGARPRRRGWPFRGQGPEQVTQQRDLGTVADLLIHQNHHHVARGPWLALMARAHLPQVLVGRAGKPGADRLPAVPPVRPRAIRGAWNLQVGEHALARAEGVLPVDPVAVSEVNHSPRDRGQRGRLGWRPVIVDLPFPGDGGVGPYGPARWRRFPVVLRVG